jgi:signal transduction histidine kinase/peptidoglycan/xylan/chitin deacetylase (PgdA/CDA1 family)
VKEMQKPLIALTFDDGPTADITPKVLNLLEKYGIPATFFVVGDNLRGEGVEIAKRAAALGCELENHGQTHTDMSNMSAAQIKSEIETTSKSIKAVTGQDTAFFRPPYIKVSDIMFESIDETFICGYVSKDYLSEITPETIIKNVLTNAEDGTIILLHDFSGNFKTVTALETIIPVLLKTGFTFVTVKQLFRLKSVVPEKGEMYNMLSSDNSGNHYVSDDNSFSERLFMNIFQTMDAAVILKPDNKPIANSKFDEIMPGWEKVFTKGQSLDSLYDFFDRITKNPQDHLDTIKRLRETRESQETLWHFKTGKTYSTRGFVVTTDDNAENYAELWILRDITEIETQFKLFDSVFEIMDDPAILFLPDRPPIGNSAYSKAFPGWQKVYRFGQDTDDELRNFWAQYVYNIDEISEQVIKLRETHENQEIIWHFKDGTEILYKATIVEISDNSFAELWISRDVTRLYDALRRANDASLAKSMFLSSMSHEIRTPMNAIIGMTSLALKTDDTARIKRYLEKTEEAGHRLMSLINDVLDMSKIESGKLHISESAFDYEKMIDTAVNVIADTALEKRIEVKTLYNKPVERFMLADELRVSQVIVNLLSNAVKFTRDCGTITLSSEFIDENRLRVSCTDTGIGISEEAMEKLFRSFEQADKSITRKYGGTGLGLAISKQIVELMGGQIFAQSINGKGSCFTFEIPIRWGGEIRTASGEINSLANKSAAEKVLDGKHILLVEDIDVNRMIVTMLLEEYGCIIDEAENGQIALDMAQENPYDLVLMDMQMPVMDGLTATRELRRLGLTIPIIAMTANAFKEDAEACIAAGMNAHVAKPIDSEAFMALLIEYLGK